MPTIIITKDVGKRLKAGKIVTFPHTTIAKLTAELGPGWYTKPQESAPVEPAKKRLGRPPLASPSLA